MSLTLAAGTRLGPYEILSPLGAGGMGEVYRARDTRLGRDVAVKVLPQHLSSDPDIRARFEREARSISSLNHPNICTLFDVGNEGDVEYLVMELVDGVTLAERLMRGPLPAAELLRIGRQVADALDRAHRAGIIHRDLKPGNIMLTKSGAKLMDFGLARAAGAAGGPGSGAAMTAFTHTPTVAQALTTQGTLVGTFQYMAPEQLEGGEADARSDVWALGCVLYEMASGRRPFDGRSQASLIAAILEREPAPLAEASSGSTSVAGAIPTGLGRIIRNCLAKDPDDRIRTAHDVKLQLDGVAEAMGLSNVATPLPAAGPVSGAMPAPGMAAPAVRRGPSPLWWLVTAGLALAAGLAGALWPRPAAPPPPPVRFRLESVPGVTSMFWPRLSPDGRSLLFSGTDSTGVVRSYVRPIDQLAAVPVAGSEGVGRPYWSPDGRDVAFVADQKIKRVALGGGAPVIVCAGVGADLSWGSGGQILMDGSSTDSLQVVSASGGELKPATRIYRADGEIGSAWPCFLPDGKHFLFIGNRSGSSGNIRLGTLGSLDSKLLGRSDGRVEYAGGGWVVFLRERTLLAQKLDLGAGKLVGEPLTLADEIWLGRADGHFSASASGALAYRTGAGAEQSTVIMADREGRPIGEPLLSANGSGFDLSPDGRRLLYCRSEGPQGSGGDIHVFDLERRTDTALTFTRESAASPFWSPDGQRFACLVTGANGATHLHVGGADGLGKADSLGTGGGACYLSDWSPGGAGLLCWQLGVGAWRVPLGGGSVVPFTDLGRQFYQPVLSPDERWMVATVGALTDYQVFVFSNGPTPGRWQISQRPAVFGTWTKGGREIIFEEMNGGGLMAADVETEGGFRAGSVRRLFRLPSSSFGPGARSWGVDASGTRFVLSVPPPRSSTGNIEVLTSIEPLVNRK
jgi:hypothetical protein